jgi:hypothetical protein
MWRRSAGVAERRLAEAEAACERAQKTVANERGRARSLEAQLAEARQLLRAAFTDRRQGREAAAAAATQAQLARIALEKECAAQLGSLRDEHARQQKC